MKIRTKTNPKLYVSGIHGVSYLSYVLELDVAHALEFHSSNAEAWVKILKDLSPYPLEAVPTIAKQE